MRPDYTPKDIQRFWSKVDRRAPDECWNWLAGLNSKGYGAFSIGGRTGTMKGAHRVAYELANGAIPDDLDVLHSCDNPSCCNPQHLFAGTALDNMRDMIAKGRQNKRRGETHPKAQLTAEQVRTIRSRYAAGGVSQSALAREFGVTHQSVNLIVNRKTWS